MHPMSRMAAATVMSLAGLLIAQQQTPPRTGADYQARLVPVPTSDHPVMKIGTSAPDFKLKGTDGKDHTLAEFSKGKLLVVFFESVHCPVSQNYEERMRALYDEYHPKGIDFVAINPNNPAAVRLNELNYTDLTDAPGDMKIRVANRHIEWPYLYDGETQALTQKYGAIATPHVFIFDGERKLQYQGRIDDNQNEALVKVHDAHDAIEALLAGQEVAVANRPAFGCSTKWIEKSQDVQKEWAKIESEPVTLTKASVDDLKAVKENAGNKVAVVHFWSTSQKNVQESSKDLVTTWFWYANRPYQYINVNTDGAASEAKVLEILKSQHAYNTNLQIAGADLKGLGSTFDAAISPKEEFTVVIAPGGKIVYSRKGPVNIQDIRHAVLNTFPDNRAFPGQAKYWSQLKWR